MAASNATEVRRLYLNGRWAEPQNPIEVFNPATGELIGTIPLSAEQDVARAVEAADRAFDMWRRFPAPKRAEIVHRASDLLCERKQYMGELLTREMGKVLRPVLDNRTGSSGGHALAAVQPV